jgi:hypothetical protein
MMPRSPRFSVRTGAWALVPVVAGVAVAVAAARVPILTPDVWWHLATGREIAATGIPTTDPFSYTLGDRRWLVHEWLAEWVLFTLYRSAGFLGLVWWRGIAIALAAAIAYRLARRHAAMAVTLPVLALAVYASQRNWIDRPQLWTYVLLPLVVWCLEAAREGQRRAAWALVPLVAVWVNVHGGFMIGLAVILAWQAAAIATRGRAARRAAVVIGAGCVLATLANPHGWRGAVYPLQYLGTGLSATIHEERAGRLDSPYAWVHWGLAVALLVLTLVRVRRVPLAHTVTAMLLVWISWPRLGGWAPPFAAERHAPLLLFAGAPLLCWRIDERLPAAWREKGAGLVRAARRGPVWSAAAILAAFAVWHLWRAAPRDGRFEARVLPGRFPAAAAQWLAAARLPGNLVNPYRWGGFLAFQLAPHTKVWIDSRGDLYGEARLAEDELLYRMPAGSEPAVARLLDRYDANVIVWFLLSADTGAVRTHPLSRWLLQQPDWRLVFVDAPRADRADLPAGTTAVFLREHPRNAVHLARYPAVRLPALP